MDDQSPFGIPSKLTTSDGVEIKDGLLKAIRSSQDPSLLELIPEIESASPVTDSGETLYLKTWRLDRKRGRILKRPVGVSEGPIFEADVSKRNGQWVVGEVSVGRLTRPH